MLQLVTHRVLNRDSWIMVQLGCFLLPRIRPIAPQPYDRCSVIAFVNISLRCVSSSRRRIIGTCYGRSLVS